MQAVLEGLRQYQEAAAAAAVAVAATAAVQQPGSSSAHSGSNILVKFLLSIDRRNDTAAALDTVRPSAAVLALGHPELTNCSSARLLNQQVHSATAAVGPSSCHHLLQSCSACLLWHISSCSQLHSMAACTLCCQHPPSTSIAAAQSGTGTRASKHLHMCHTSLIGTWMSSVPPAGVSGHQAVRCGGCRPVRQPCRRRHISDM
jgi:hypothetical protein